MQNTDRYKATRLAGSKKTSITVRALSNAGAVVEQHATKSLAANVLGQSGVLKTRSARAPHLLDVERELAELKKVVAALAVRSVAHEEPSSGFDTQGITVLDAETAYQLLDNPPEPTEALRNLLALR